jgi:hypothetical protein
VQRQSGLFWIYPRKATCSSTVLPSAVCGCETWSVIRREQHRLRVFENGVLTKTIGAKREEVTG